METTKRFTYSHSHVYGWCVYDNAQGKTPAYDACCELLPPLSSLMKVELHAKALSS